MPEYLAPGVFVEEVSFRQQTIEGVSTSTTGFVGPARFGPLAGEPPLLTSFADFERIYGGLDQLDFSDSGLSHNFLAHAVRAYFEEGGKRLYVARTYNSITNEPLSGPMFSAGRWIVSSTDTTVYQGGIGRWPQDTGQPPDTFGLRARYPGAAGNVMVGFLLRVGDNILDPGTPLVAGEPAQPPTLRGIANHAVVLARLTQAPELGWQTYWVDRYFDDNLQEQTFRLRQDNPGPAPNNPVALGDVQFVRPLTVTVVMSPMGRFNQELTWENLGFDPRHLQSLSTVFAAAPTRRATALSVPLVFATELRNGAAIADTLLDQLSLAGSIGSPLLTVRDGIEAQIAGNEDRSADRFRSFQVELVRGNDGARPVLTQYRGLGSTDDNKIGLRAFEDLEDISIVAAPGCTRGFLNGYQINAQAIIRTLIAHCERMRYRVAVLDAGDGFTLADVRELRGVIDSTRAALYYPWVRTFDPVTETEILQPPSGFVTGIYARNDVNRGVHKAPANEVIRLALGFEFMLNTAQQEALNPEGINVLRFFEGRGFRVWGARTVSSNPEWKYLNVRRYFAFLERSIEKGTQFAVFEPNGPVLWANIQQTVADFLFNEWASNHLLGTRPEQAFFVRCDETTMTQNDLDNGRLICLIGVAPLRPAEFVIFRIGQKTADARS